MEGRAFAALDAVVVPQYLGNAVGLDTFVETAARPGRGEGNVALWMPILGEYDTVEKGRHRVDGSKHPTCVPHGQGAAVAEILLEVDDEEGAELSFYFHGLNSSDIDKKRLCSAP